MEVRIPYLLSDRQYLFDTQDPGGPFDTLIARPTGFVTIRDAGPFYDGPVTPRVAVVDFADSGSLRMGARYQADATGHPGARLLAHARGRSHGTYEVDRALLDPDVIDANPMLLEDSTFVQISTFAIVYRSMQFFEEFLGRQATWAFDGSQLLVVPRAGEMRNAFYERESRSLQFFEFPMASKPGHNRTRTRNVLTALSHDIVAHETAHAILDGVAPDLYDSITPESLAMHEAVADLTALLMPMTDEDDVVVWSLDNISSVDLFDALGQVAEEFGRDLRRSEEAMYLRSADNNKTLVATDTSRDSLGNPNLVSVTRPHELSLVLTGSIFSTLRRHAESMAKSKRDDRRAAIAARHMARLLIPALDLLPPGDATFRNLAQAIATVAAYSRSGPKLARWFCEELVRRGVVTNVAELAPPAVPVEPLSRRDFEALQAGEPSARDFADRHRNALGIPEDADVKVLSVRRSRQSERNRRLRPWQRLILRVSWDTMETHHPGTGLGTSWCIRAGVTVAIDSDTRRIVSLLHTDSSPRARASRGSMLKYLADEGVLLWAADAMGPTGRLLGSVIAAHPVTNGMRIRSGARLLHIADPEA